MKGWKGVISVLRIAEALDVLLVVLLIFANTVSRYVFKTSFVWIEEILTICALWMYFIGAVLGAEEESHIKGDLVSSSIRRPGVKKWFLAAVALVTAVSATFFAVWAVQYCATQLKLHMLTAYLKLPKITSQFAIGFGMVGMAFYWIYHFLRYLTAKPFEDKGAHDGKDGDEKEAEG